MIAQVTKKPLGPDDPGYVRQPYRPKDDERKARRLYGEAEIELIGEHQLKYGNSCRCVCPWCGGGSSKEKSLSVTRAEGMAIYYNCFRAKCGRSGRIMLKNAFGERYDPYYTRIGRKRTSSEPFDRPVEPLDRAQIVWFREKFGFNPGNDLLWCPSMQRYANRVYGPLGQHRGWVLRRYDSIPPKSLEYPLRDEPFLAWFKPPLEPFRTGLVVVEDLDSARKVVQAGMPSVALLGTGISFEEAYEIATQQREFGGPIYLALDRGTLQIMISYRQRFGEIWGSTVIWQLDKDLKYVDLSAIQGAIVNGITDFIG